MSMQTLWLTAGGVFIAVLVGIVGTVVYIDGVKINVAEQAIQLKNLEEGQKDTRTTLKSELGRLEALIEKRVSEIIERFKPTPPAAPTRQEKKQGQ